MHHSGATGPAQAMGLPHNPYGKLPVAKNYVALGASACQKHPTFRCRIWLRQCWCKAFSTTFWRSADGGLISRQRKPLPKSHKHLRSNG